MLRRSLLHLLGLGAAGVVSPVLAGPRGQAAAAPSRRIGRSSRCPLRCPCRAMDARPRPSGLRTPGSRCRTGWWSARLPQRPAAGLGGSRGGGALRLQQRLPRAAAADAGAGPAHGEFRVHLPVPWCAGYAEVSGTELPFEAVKARPGGAGGGVDARRLERGDPLRQAVEAVAAAALEDLGIGVVELERQGSGGWRPRPGRHDRRISGLSGWRDPAQRLRVSGPAAPVFRRAERLGFDDGLGDAVIGTFANCAGGQTPGARCSPPRRTCRPTWWRRCMPMAPPRIRRPVPSASTAAGSRDWAIPSASPATSTAGWWRWNPRRPERPAVKHSWLGRFRHEAVAVRAAAGEPLVVYSGCDRHGGHLYRFVSADPVDDPSDPANSPPAGAGPAGGRPLRSPLQLRWRRPGPLDPPGSRHAGRSAAPEPLRSLRAGESRAAPPLRPQPRRCREPGQRRRGGGLTAPFPGPGFPLCRGRRERDGRDPDRCPLAANAVGATPAARPEDTELDPRNG